MPKPNILSQSIQRELELTGFLGQDFQSQQIEDGGAVNTSYCLRANDRRYFMKTFESDDIAKLDRRALFAIQKTLFEGGKASKPVYLSQACDFQIDEWIEQPTLDKCHLSMKDKIQALAYVLADIHQQSTDAPLLDLPYQWQHYLMQLDKVISREHKRELEQYGEYWYTSCGDETVFCHNDLSLKHVTQGEPVIIFDWEYCALSSPYFDLASCAQVNQLSDMQGKLLCHFYAQRTGRQAHDIEAKMHLMTPLVNLTSELWYQAAHVASTNNPQSGC
ncbi:MAG: thiamine kinase [Paraglaciecola sp.]|jgi:thiamine kinase